MDKKIVMPESEAEAVSQIMELAEYYQQRCFEAERLLMDVCTPFRFFWFGERFRRLMVHCKKWKDRLPTIYKPLSDGQ